MAPGFNTRCNPQLLRAIIRAAKQLREISTARIPQGQKVKETLFCSLSGYLTPRDMSCKNRNTDVFFFKTYVLYKQKSV